MTFDLTSLGLLSCHLSQTGGPAVGGAFHHILEKKIEIAFFLVVC